MGFNQTRFNIAIKMMLLQPNRFNQPVSRQIGMETWMDGLEGGGAQEACGLAGTVHRSRVLYLGSKTAV